MKKMIDHDELRRKKQRECDERISRLHTQVPRLAEIADRIAYLSFNMLKKSVRQRSAADLAPTDREVRALLKERQEILQSMGLDESVYEPSWDCPLCQDKGYVRPGVPCKCVLQEKQRDLISASGIPAALREKRFSNFQTVYYTEPGKMAQKVELCRQIAARIINGQPCDNLLFLGDVGRGKTHLSLAVANEVLDNGRSVIYRRMNDLLEEIRRCKYDSRDEDFLRRIYDCDLLVIDDFGADGVTDFAKTQMRILIEERNLNDKPWIISTNLDINLIGELYSPRLADRLIEKTRVFSFDAPQSIREILRTERLQ